MHPPEMVRNDVELFLVSHSVRVCTKNIHSTVVFAAMLVITFHYHLLMSCHGHH